MSEAPKRVRVTFFTDGEPAAVYYDHEAEGRELFLSAAALRELCEELRFASLNVPDIPSKEFGNGAKHAYEVVAGMIKALLEGK